MFLRIVLNWKMKHEIHLNFWDNETLICDNAFLLNYLKINK